MRKIIDNILGKGVAALMGFLVLVVLWQVTSRYVVASPSSYTDEMAGFLLIWVGLLGAAYVCGQGEHLAIDLLLQKSKPKTKITLQMIIHTLVILFSVTVLVIGGIWLVYTRFMLEVTSASLELNLGYVYLALPLCGVLMIYYSIDNARRMLKEFRESANVSTK